VSKLSQIKFYAHKFTIVFYFVRGLSVHKHGLRYFNFPSLSLRSSSWAHRSVSLHIFLSNKSPRLYLTLEDFKYEKTKKISPKKSHLYYKMKNLKSQLEQRKSFFLFSEISSFVQFDLFSLLQSSLKPLSILGVRIKFPTKGNDSEGITKKHRQFFPPLSHNDTIFGWISIAVTLMENW